MKKRLLWLLSILILSFALTGSAWADNEYLGAFPAGNSLSVSLSGDAGFPEDAAVQLTSGSLPDSCSLTLSGGRLYLTGTPMLAGSYEFSASVSYSGAEFSGGEEFVCSLIVEPAVPSVSASGAVDCRMNDSVTLTVSASANDSGSLSYQWYMGSSPDPSAGTPLSGATANRYMPSTAASGTLYYYCRVTNTNNGRAGTSAASPVIPVTVAEHTPTSISVSTLPTKLAYEAGERIDPAGLTLTVQYSDGSFETLTGGFSLSPATTTEELGAITVTWGEFTCSFPIVVTPSQPKEQAITVINLPQKLSYSVGDTLDTTGLKLRLITSKGYEDLSSGFSCSPMVLSTPGTQEITVKYHELSCVFRVTVENAKLSEHMSIRTLPTKLNYTVGEAVDLKGLVLRVTIGDSFTDVTSGFACEPQVLDTAGTQTVTVTYGSNSCTFQVTVAEAAAVTPAPTAVPTTPAPSGSGTASGGSRGMSAALRSLLIFMVILVVLAIAALVAYFLLFRRPTPKAMPRKDLKERLQDIAAEEPKEEFYEGSAPAEAPAEPHDPDDDFKMDINLDDFR